MVVMEMSELLWRHDQFVVKLESDYRLSGYEILDSQSYQHEFGGYVPDLVVRKGERVTLIEVQSTDKVATHPRIGDLRKQVENNGYGFAVKIVPRTPVPRPLEEYPERVRELLSRARILADDGDQDLALLASWIAIEICVRTFVQREGVELERPPQSREIISMAADWELIEEKQLPEMRVLMDLRSRIAHGYASGSSAAMVQKAIAYAQDLASKTGLIPGISPS